MSADYIVALISTIYSLIHFRWFETFVTNWLNENDSICMDYSNGAFEKDRMDGVGALLTVISDYIEQMMSSDKDNLCACSSREQRNTFSSHSPSLMYLRP